MLLISSLRERTDLGGDDVTHLCITGQSLSVGTLATGSQAAVVTLADPTDSLRASTNAVFGPFSDAPASTPMQATVDRAAVVTGGRWSGLTTGLAGSAYSGIKKGTATYDALILGVQRARAAAAGQLRGMSVPAVFIVHGETDTNDGVTASEYEDFLDEWATDLRSDIVAATGQDDPPAIIIDQTNSWPKYTPTEPTVALGQLAAAVNNPAIFMVGPKYHLGYGIDEKHLTNEGYARLGEMHHRALASILSSGSWDCLRPVSASLAGSVITVQYNVPVAPLVFDTTTVAAQTNRGFTVESDSGAETISSVALGGDGTSVEITLSGTPGTNPRAQYGFAGQYGNLCDSEPATSVYNGDSFPLANWCVHSEVAVT